MQTILDILKRLAGGTPAFTSRSMCQFLAPRRTPESIPTTRPISDSSWSVMHCCPDKRIGPRFAQSCESVLGVLLKAREQLRFTSHCVGLPSDSHAELVTGERKRNHVKQVCGVTWEPTECHGFLLEFEA